MVQTSKVWFNSQKNKSPPPKCSYLNIMASQTVPNLYTNLHTLPICHYLPMWDRSYCWICWSAIASIPHSHTQCCYEMICCCPAIHVFLMVFKVLCWHDMFYCVIYSLCKYNRMLCNTYRGLCNNKKSVHACICCLRQESTFSLCAHVRPCVLPAKFGWFNTRVIT